MATYTLGQSVQENSALFFLQENFGVQFLPEGSTPQWEAGVVSALYVLQIRVQCCVHFFLGTLRNFFMSVCAHSCAHMHCIIYAFSSFALTH